MKTTVASVRFQVSSGRCQLSGVHGHKLASANCKLQTLAAGQQGFALITVILILLLVSFLAAELTFGVRSETVSGFNEAQQVKGRALALAGINSGLFHLLDKPLNEDEQGPYELGDSRDLWLPEGRTRFQVVSESGKIDVNYLDKQLLLLLLEHLGTDEEQADIIYDSLLDWIDDDDLHRLNGAENDYYQGLDQPYVARNGKMRDPSEFLLLRGTEELVGRLPIYDMLTTKSRTAKLAFNELTPAMLDFLTAGDEEAVALFYELREQEGRLQAVHAQLILGEERYGLLSPYLTFGRTRTSYYTISATGYAGELQEEQAEEETENRPHRPGSKVSVLLERRGKKIVYHGWQEGWS